MIALLAVPLLLFGPPGLLGPLDSLGPLGAQEPASTAASAPESVTSDWPSVWTELVALEEAEVQSEQAAELRRRLEATAEARAGTARGELLSRHLARLAGAPNPESPAWLTGPAPSFTGRERWLAAEVIPPGPDRVRAVLAALDAPDGEPVDRDRRYLMCAWGTAVAEARARRLQKGAQPIQERLHAHFEAPWTALDLSLTHLLGGDPEAADAVLAAVIAREGPGSPSVLELWSQRGNVALAIGDERRARDYLGWALGRGSGNAAVVLARLDLDAGRVRPARTGFRALLWGDDPGAWALRGWGLSLLPSSNSSSLATDRTLDPNER